MRRAFAVRRSMSALLLPGSLRPTSTSRHVAATGMHALPIIGLMAVMTAIVLDYQGAARRRRFGGEDYTINPVAASVYARCCQCLRSGVPLQWPSRNLPTP